MKEHGILFSSPMVRAILDGRKTQTRRVVKDADEGLFEWGHYGDFCQAAHGGYVKAPHGPVGRRLWVRETFSPCGQHGELAKPSDAAYVVLRDGTQVYRDGKVIAGLVSYAPGAFDNIKWRPAIHMPRWASRITLEVTGVRVERVQSITEEDALAEGMDWAAPYMGKVDRRRRQDDDREDPREVGYGEGSFARQNYMTLWDEINGAGSWASNPWVWVYEFRRIGHGE